MLVSSLVLALCVLGTELFASAVDRLSGLSFLPAPTSGQVCRRQLLSVLAAVTPAGLPRAAQAEQDSPRLSLYKGKAVGLRSGSEWYRFYIGNKIRSSGGDGSEEAVSANSEDCGAGTCPAAQALSDVLKALSSGSRGGQRTLSQIDVTLLTPMNTLADMALWDPDTVDVGKDQAAAFQRTLVQMAKSIRQNRDPVEAQALYTQSLRDLNEFFRTANLAMGATPDDAWALPTLPLTSEQLDADEYWRQEKEAYIAATDPIKEFQERNAFGSRELRQGLKRFPGATLLLR